MADKAATGLNPQRQLAQDDINGVCFLYPRGQRAFPGHGLPCGNLSQGAGCPPGYLCVARSGSSQAYCMSRCDQERCENRGTCAKTTTGNNFCTCDSDEQCSSSSRCLNFSCWEISLSCRFDGDCKPGQQCNNRTCVPRDADTCSSDQDCPGGGCTGGICPIVANEISSESEPQEPMSSQDSISLEPDTMDAADPSTEFASDMDGSQATDFTHIELIAISETSVFNDDSTASAEISIPTGCQCRTEDSWPVWGWFVVGWLLWIRRSAAKSHIPQATGHESNH